MNIPLFVLIEQLKEMKLILILVTKYSKYRPLVIKNIIVNIGMYFSQFDLISKKLFYLLSIIKIEKSFFYDSAISVFVLQVRACTFTFFNSTANVHF